MLKNKITLVIIFITAFLLIVACNSGARRPETAANKSPNESGTATNSSNGKSYDTKVKIKTPDGKDFVEVKADANGTKLEYNGKVLRGETKDDKRKYALENGSLIAEVKFKDADGFKVRTSDGTLLWKIKIAADKIKISDNEENQNAFEIKKNADGAKIERGETKLGEVKFYPDKQKIKVKDAADREIFDGNTNIYSTAYGVLALNKIPEDLRLIILAELLARDGWR